MRTAAAELKGRRVLSPKAPPAYCPEGPCCRGLHLHPVFCDRSLEVDPAFHLRTPPPTCHPYQSLFVMPASQEPRLALPTGQTVCTRRGCFAPYRTPPCLFTPLLLAFGPRPVPHAHFHLGPLGRLARLSIKAYGVRRAHMRPQARSHVSRTHVSHACIRPSPTPANHCLSRASRAHGRASLPTGQQVGTRPGM